MNKPRITGFTADEIATMREGVRVCFPALSEKIRKATLVTTAAAKLSAEEQVEALQLDAELRIYARRYGHDPEDVLENWRESKRSNGYKVGRNLIANARSAFMYWIRNTEPKKMAQQKPIKGAEKLR